MYWERVAFIAVFGNQPLSEIRTLSNADQILFRHYIAEHVNSQYVPRDTQEP